MYFSDILTASNFRSNIYNALKEVITKSQALKVTSKAGNVVVLPEEEYNSMQETFYLMKNPVNAERLQQGIDSLNRAVGMTKSVEELESLNSTK